MPGYLSRNSPNGGYNQLFERLGVFGILTIGASVDESFVPDDQALNLSIVGVYGVDVRGPTR